MKAFLGLTVETTYWLAERLRFLLQRGYFIIPLMRGNSLLSFSSPAKTTIVEPRLQQWGEARINGRWGRYLVLTKY
jgi:hypothetical protein